MQYWYSSQKALRLTKLLPAATTSNPNFQLTRLCLPLSLHFPSLSISLSHSLFMSLFTTDNPFVPSCYPACWAFIRVWSCLSSSLPASALKTFTYSYSCSRATWHSQANPINLQFLPLPPPLRSSCRRSVHFPFCLLAFHRATNFCKYCNAL